MNNSENILLKPFDLAPFSKVKNEDYLPAFKELIKSTKE
jgi:Zn-dependent oligopeptidase